MAVQIPFDEALSNANLRPIAQSERKWSWYSYMALWMGMVHNIFNYEVAASLIVLGMNIWQALLTIFVADLILMVPLALNGYVGNKYGIPFPVFARLAFGVFGANIPALIRAFVAIGWFGVQSFLGSTALNALLILLIPSWSHMSGTFLGLPGNGWIALLLFWVLQGVVATHGMDVIRRFENWAGPVILIVMLGLVVWAVTVLHGMGPIFTEPSKFKSSGAFWAVFGPGVISVIGSWASMGLNIPDFTRFSRSTKDQVVGQFVGLPITTFVFSLMASFITSATIVAFGSAIWDPVQLLQHFKSPVVLILGAAALTIATMSVNVASNLVSPIYDLINAFPRKLNFRSAAIVSMVIAFVIMPWKLMQSPQGIDTLLNTAGAFLGPATGIVIADFWLLRTRRVKLTDLYTREGVYRYSKGFNVTAIVVLIISMLVSFAGNFLPIFKVFAGYGWLIGVVLGFVLYYIVMKMQGYQAEGTRQGPSGR
ncbi:NCS1 family nucleobase:cation symporter-1 [Alicyclobacillus mengziensis]|uniref:NCS1 family nucleobase:cation symporter-1 n=1 Tax=Alicyclobacillus mengziensis TaxID=2931921 RepID=A0A9X7VYK8_9BACL|nr:NCS1 family nucleobase:cation symporter-1 [Alicyclobacillus mengziensis]QSO47406.1 NCS1 family nucleobase:cation symporter-1 [Alicyclobacillus mengziensis]